jgi:hypothetical protein
MTAQELDAELFLELPDLQAQRRLRDVELLRGAGDVAELDDARKVLKLTKCDDAPPAR